MKKLVFGMIALFLVHSSRAQCVPSCSAYIVSPITYTTYSGLGGNSGYGSNEVVLSDDAVSGSIPIGFTFTFYCNAYNNIQISSNGYITFDINTFVNGCCSGMTIPTSQAPNDYIALGWNDWYPPGGATIAYATTGTAPNRMFIVTYTNVPHCCTNGPPVNSGQIILHETTNEIEIHSGEITNDGNSNTTQGIENINGTLGVPAPGRNGSTFTTTNTAYKWFAGGSPSPVTSITGGSGVICEGSTNSFTAATMPGALSYNWGLPPGWNGSSTTTVLNATAGQSGTISVSATYTCGTSAPYIFTLTTVAAPVITGLSASPNILCSGNNVTITASASGAMNYSLEPGGLTGLPPFVVTPSVNTTYSLAAVNGSGCVSFNPANVNVTVKETPTVTVNNGTICLGESFTISPTGASNYTLSSIFNVVTPTSVGANTYSVVGTNSTGCLSNQVISTVSVNPLPNTTASASRLTICRQESTVLSATGASTYSWSTGATTASLSVSPLSPINYTVTGTTGGCVKTAVVSIDVRSCTGVNELDGNENDIVVFPNPSNGEFNLNTPHPCHAVIYDLLGKIIYDKQLSEGVHTINLSQFANGKYLLKTTNDNRQQNMMLIKQ